jgi:hypothetical protein
MIHEGTELPVIPAQVGIHLGKGDFVLDARENGHDSYGPGLIANGC